jgi:deoxycytidylate deaminase
MPTWTPADFERLARAASRSPCRRLHVGCILRATRNGIAQDFVAWNKPRFECDGLPGVCGCVHAEARAITAMLSSVSACESIDVLLTDSPCIKCALALTDIAGRFKARLSVSYQRAYRLKDGVNTLMARGHLVGHLNAR